MYDFFKSFQEDKCIEKVKKVFFPNTHNVNVFIYHSKWLAPTSLSILFYSFLMRSPLTSARSPVDWRMRQFSRRGECSSWGWGRISNKNFWLQNFQNVFLGKFYFFMMSKTNTWLYLVTHKIFLKNPLLNMGQGQFPDKQHLREGKQNRGENTEGGSM